MGLINDQQNDSAVGMRLILKKIKEKQEIALVGEGHRRIKLFGNQA
jgi:hypothetical protein